jgi:hypothetical protein
VLPEQTLIGTASALHIQKDKIKHDAGNGKYVELASAPSQPTIIQGSPIIGRKPKARVSKRKK